jgi:very-short-patch-repair endonuclease/prophage antirepressor-like protein
MTEDQEIEFIIEDETALETYEYSHDGNNFQYFIGKEIAKLLGYNSTDVIKKYVSESNKITFKEYKGVKEPKINSKTILITKDGIEEILKRIIKKISKETSLIFNKYDIKIDEINEEDEINQEDEIKEEDILSYSYVSNGIFFEYFVGYQITSLMGYKNVNQAINNVSKSNQLEFRDYPGVKIPNLDPRTILITADGAVEILVKSRKRISPDVLYLLKKFNIDTTNRKCLTKEQQTLSTITNVFKTEKFEDQFKIGTYYLDLYFPEYKIVLECDENGHADRKPWKERERMDFVNKELNIDDTNWIRFNPDEHDFDIAKVIGAVYRKIDEIKDKTRKSTDERQCFRCNVDKKLEFFKKSSTGFTKTCIDCLDKDKNNRTKKFKPVRQYTLGGVFIKQFESVKEAADALNISSGQISANCRNPTKIKTAGKYMWKFANEQKEKNIDGMKSDVIKTVAQYNTDGEFIKTFSSGHEAASEYDVTPSSIYGAIRNNFVSKGFLWRYVEDGVIIPKIDKVTPHRKYMKQVDIYKDDVLFKSFLSIREAANEMKINITMCRKFLEGTKNDPVGYKWKFKVI